ncbi:MAG: LysE family translocator [Candidatus Limnocylindrales bacterium]
MSAFLLVAGVVVITPGPDMAVVARNALAGGRGAGIATTLGIVTGLVVWATAAVLGLAALLRASSEAWTVIQLLGAVYLVVLGAQTLWATWARSAPPAGSPRRRVGIPTGSPFRQGLLTNLLNPKVALLFTSFLPQFVTPGPDAALETAVLAAAFLAMGLIWLIGLSVFTTSFGDLLRRPRVRRGMDTITGVVLVALGLRMATEVGRRG